MKKILVLAVLVAVGCASLSKLKPYYDEAKTVIGYVMDRIEYDDPKEEPAPDAPPVVTPPAPEGKVVVHPDHVNWYGKHLTVDGHGDFKSWGYDEPMHPSPSKLWMLPTRIHPADIKTVGIYRADGSLVRWCNWPNGIGPWSGKPIDGSQVYADPTHPFGWRSHMPAKDGSNMDHVGKIKIRQARPPEVGMELRCIDIFGVVVARMPIQDLNVRHKGRLK
jgi:hypothetical protein